MSTSPFDTSQGTFVSPVASQPAPTGITVNSPYNPIEIVAVDNPNYNPNAPIEIVAATNSDIPTGWSVSNITNNFDYSKYTSAESNASLGTPGIGQSMINGLTRALPAGFKTDLQTLSDFRLGTYLRRHGNLTGDQASILDGAIDFIRSDKSKSAPQATFAIDYTKNFIPIIIKSQFNLDRTSVKPFYIVFDSTPETISFSKSATWNPQSFYGRPEPIQVYASSGSVSFSLTGIFFSVNPEDHNDKLNLSNRLFALTTPSKYHLMPSPIELKIGEWKHLRCIVTDVKVDYKGPWWIASGAKKTTKPLSLNQASNTSSVTDPVSVTLPSHAPYIYEATFSFTVVSELNSVQYAEDIMKSGWNGGLLGNSIIGDGGYSNSASIRESSETFKGGTILNDFSVSGSIPGNILTNNQMIEIDDAGHSDLKYLQSLGLPSDSSGGTKLAAMTQITSGLTASVTGIINNKFGAKISKMLGK